jgi:hypothetical protein
MMEQLPKAQKAGSGRGHVGEKGGLSENPTLNDQGIDKNLAHKARKLGALSEKDFETAVRAVRVKGAGRNEPRISVSAHPCYLCTPTLRMPAMPRPIPKEDIIAAVEGSDLCYAAGYTVKDQAPVLAMCRLLVQAGFDPRRPLVAFRGAELAMRIKSIEYGAHYSVAENQTARFRAVKRI